MRRISLPVFSSTAVVLLLAGACGILAPAAGAWRAVGSASSFVPRYHTTTGPKPPASVVKGYARTAARATGEDHVIAGVPAYAWRHGCGPTATGMVVGYYDSHGFDDLIPGDASSQTAATLQAIASDSSGGGGAGHYEDYSFPTDDGGPLKLDKSELPAGDEHASNSIADFMHTSWSVQGLTYGSSWTNMVGPAFAGYVNYRNSAYAPGSAGHSVGDPVLMTTWNVLKGEVDAGRPMVLIVDCSGDGQVDHAVTGIGYRENGGLLEYGYLNTWDTGIHWAQYRPPSASYAWGIYGVTTLSLSGWTPPDPPPPPPPPPPPDPTPTPEPTPPPPPPPGPTPPPDPTPTPDPIPTPTPTPTPDPKPPADITPPVTLVIGADDTWHGGPVELTFSAMDTGSGVARTEASLDGGLVWQKGTTLVVDGSGVHSVLFRSLDKAGNLEPEHSCTVRIDTASPKTAARAASVKRGRSVSLRYRVGDLAPEASVTLVLKNARGKTVKTLALGPRATNKDLSCRFVCKLRRGAYRYFVYATDPAGNSQAKPASAKLTVR